MPARRKPATQREPDRQYLRPQVESVRPPVTAPRLPGKTGGWSPGASRRWKSWWSSGRAAALDEAGVEALIALIRLVDDMERAESPSLRLRLASEVRRQEAALLPAAGAAAPPSQATTREDRMRARAAKEKARREHALAGLDHGVWPGYEPGEPPEVTDRRYADAALMDANELTYAQRRECERHEAKYQEREAVMDTTEGGA